MSQQPLTPVAPESQNNPDLTTQIHPINHSHSIELAKLASINRKVKYLEVGVLLAIMAVLIPVAQLAWRVDSLLSPKRINQYEEELAATSQASREAIQASKSLQESLKSLADDAKTNINTKSGDISSQLGTIITQFGKTNTNLNSKVDLLYADLHPILLTANQNLISLDKVENTLDKQIAQNGDQLHTNLEDIHNLVVNENGLQALVAKYSKIADHLELIAEDPSILNSLHHFENTFSNVEVTTNKIALTSSDLYDLEHKIVEPIISPKPVKGFFPKLKRFALIVSKVTTGIGYSAYLINSISTH